MDHPVADFSKTLFVSGTGRSGTNVTKQLFSAHPSVATLPFEHRFTIDPRGVTDFLNTYPQIWSPYWPEYKIRDFISFLVSLGKQEGDKSERVKAAKAQDPKGLKIAPPPYAGWELEQWIPNYFEHVHALEAELVSFHYKGIWPGTEEGTENSEMIFAPNWSKAELLPKLQRFLDNVNRSILQQQQKEVFLEDNTHSILFANDLLDLYPNSKLLHVIRDPRDVIASLLEQRWAPSHLMDLIAWYEQVIARWEEVKAQCDPSRIKEVRFEDLVHDTSHTVEAICSFYELSFQDKLLRLDLSKHNIGRFKSTFNQEEIDALNTRLKQYLEVFGYES